MKVQKCQIPSFYYARNGMKRLNKVGNNFTNEKILIRFFITEQFYVAAIVVLTWKK